MNKLIIAHILLLTSINCFADCEYRGSFKKTDISIPAEFKSRQITNKFQSTYLICRSKKPAPPSNMIEFNINHGAYIQSIDHDWFTFTTPQLALLNDGQSDYLVVSVTPIPGQPATYSYECDFYLCRK